MYRIVFFHNWSSDDALILYSYRQDCFLDPRELSVFNIVLINF